MCSTSRCSFSTPRHGLSNRPGPLTTVYNTYHNAAQALGLLHDNSEGQLCFNEARDGGYSPAQLRSLLVTLIADGDEHGREILDSNSDILMAYLAEQECIPTEMTWNACLRDISNRLETMGRTMTEFGLLEPAEDSTEVERQCMRWAPRSCQAYVDANLPLLTLDEQRPIYEEVVEAMRLRKTLLMYVDGRSGRGKTLLMKIITAAVRAPEGIFLCSAMTGLAALNHERGMTAHATYRSPSQTGKRPHSAT